MAKVRKETKFNEVKHKYKKTSIGRRKLKTSSMNKSKRRRLSKKLVKK